MTSVAAKLEAKYEGGMFGYSKKIQGTIKFDDANERLVFFGQDQNALDRMSTEFARTIVSAILEAF